MKENYHHGNLRTALLGAVEQAILSGGIDAVTMRTVAELTGVSHTAPKHHFGSKTGLLTAFAAEGYRRLAAEFREALGATATASPSERLLALGGAYLRFAEARPALFDVMFQPHLVDITDPDYAETSASAYRPLDTVVRELYPGGEARLSDPAALATLAWGAVHGLAILQRQGALARAAPSYAGHADLVRSVLPLLLASSASPSGERD